MIAGASSRSTVIESVTQDSRTAHPGSLFVPLEGERDGHDFIPDAVEAGACAYLVARGVGVSSGPGLARAGRTGRHRRVGMPSGPGSGGAAVVGAVPGSGGVEEGVGGAAAIEVDDPLRALADMAAAARRRLGHVPVVGVTGSVGKTTTKDLATAVLRSDRRVHASIRSFNNEIGVPLTMLSAPDDAEAVVVEMGARGAGHIRRLCDIAGPTMGVITTVGLAHTSRFGSLDAVVAAKRELVECLPSAADGGTAFLNADVAEVAAMSDCTPARVVTYGLDAEADVTAGELRIDGDLIPRFVLVSRIGAGGAVRGGGGGACGAGGAAGWSSPDVGGAVRGGGAVTAGEIDVRLGARGRHAVGNALAAAAVGLSLGVPLRDVADALAAPVLSPMRMNLLRIPSGARVIDDTYNANPLSMRAALRSLAALPCPRRVAVLGVMAELGRHAAAEHAAVSSLAAELGISVIAVDCPLYASGLGSPPISLGSPPVVGRESVVEVADIDGALDALGRLESLDADTAVLVKGSRVARLERLVDQLAVGVLSGGVSR